MITSYIVPTKKGADKVKIVQELQQK